MKAKPFLILSLLVMVLIFSSCSVVEKASLHGFESDYYTLKQANQKPEKVYVLVEEGQAEVYRQTNKKPEKEPFMQIPLKRNEGPDFPVARFRKQSPDIDITSVLFKYRPSVCGQAPQLSTDFNLALYAGWRLDFYRLQSEKDPLGHHNTKIRGRGFDFGFFAGPGTTLVSPFTTLNRRADEYNGMIMQGGFAGFFELNMASFGIALGYDYLLNSDRKIWIYQNKPWLGFVVGIALN
jgi:hypothetical protein